MEENYPVLIRELERIRDKTPLAVAKHAVDVAITLMEKREKGLVVELPCQTGDTVFIAGQGTVVEAEVTSIHQNSICEEKTRWIFTIHSKQEYDIGYGDKYKEHVSLYTDNLSFGENWWLTRADAEEALNK
ncbi:hypothetical protein LJB76_02485 [Clostridia bacterium OttesenSCG-928-O13]|nr:hypothetical protein [Clostridia bacterium OttesenSCG-928-O13]